MSTLSLDVGLAAKLKVAFARNGWTEGKIDRLCAGNTLGDFLRVLDGFASVQLDKDVIDLDSTNLLPANSEIESHKKGGLWRWNVSDVRLLKTTNPGKKTVYAKVEEVYQEVRHEHILNANVLDFLLANQDLIPREWIGKGIYFWGTIYRGTSVYGKFVRLMEFRDGKWAGCRAFFDGSMNSNDYAAMHITEV